MMAPLCRLCGDRHWSSAPCVSLRAKPADSPAPAVRTVPVAPKPVKLPDVPVNPVADAVEPAVPSGLMPEKRVRAEKTGVPGVKTEFDRKAYMREYMSRKRAEAKASKGATG